MSGFGGCYACGSRDIEFHEAAGHAACVSCGVVQEENAIVSSIEFQETGDRSHVVGQFISANCSKPFAGTVRARYGGSRESREATLANAKRVIAQVATSLRLPHYFVDRSMRLYQLALQHNFLFGRRQSHIVATCLYIICRQEKSPYLLIDFADALQCNVYLLGKNYLQFIRLLGLNLPIIDPALYIHRFAIRLDFNDKMNAVVLTALRMITRFKKDWINIGRRPDGICAAAMLIASRAHGFYKGQLELAKLFRVSSDTIKRRLIDFRSTPAAQLTLEQLRLFGDSYNVENDPPCYVHNQIQEGKVSIGSSGRQESYSTVVGDITVQVPIIGSYTSLRPKSQGTLDREDAQMTLYQEIHASLNEAEAAGGSTLGVKNDLHLAYNAVQELTADLELKPKQKFVIVGDGKTKQVSSSSLDGLGSGEGTTGEEEEDVDFSMIDPAELDSYILTGEEQVKRSVIWEKNYRSFLNERDRRRKPMEDERAKQEAAALEAAMNDNNFAGVTSMSKTAKRKRVSTSSQVVNASSSYVQSMIHGLNTNATGSRKIDYNALNMFDQGEVDDDVESVDETETPEPVLNVGYSALAALSSSFSSSSSSSSQAIEQPLSILSAVTDTEMMSQSQSQPVALSSTPSKPAMAMASLKSTKTVKTSKFAPKTAVSVRTVSSADLVAGAATTPALTTVNTLTHDVIVPDILSSKSNSKSSAVNIPTGKVPVKKGTKITLSGSGNVSRAKLTNTSAVHEANHDYDFVSEGADRADAEDHDDY